ncbi:C3HC zinc finger-like-domain-containing protein [Crucibulum laeve]|uniref:C3HC zinc finger-like-domain-containing protein n=1 Tax=Crucibulum laeve TaxID=68775 RepID=A0A5C3M6X7_9AGAR|nr:C3HC zinc finger-like-domain-containing protein [Crucibulum laeve]
MNSPVDSQSSIQNTNIRATKRKLDDAFEVLDNSVISPDATDRPSPPKRANTNRSLYSTLAKYGIKSKQSKPVNASGSGLEGLSKSTPHLTAILTRAATRTKNALPFKFSSQPTIPAPLLPATAEYRPSSLPSFLSRLATFKLATYTNKPQAVDAVAASKCGWTNDGKDRLVCGLCNASWVVAGREGMNRDAANALIEKQRVSLVEAHKNGCPWKTRQCDPSIYCIPLQSPSAIAKHIKENAETLDPVLESVSVKHPLTATQLNSLRSVISSCSLSQEPDSSETGDAATPSPFHVSKQPSDTAILASLFGWIIVSPTAPEPLRRTSTASRAGSMAPSRAQTPSLSRASSVSLSRSSPKPKLQIFQLSPKLHLKRDNTMLRCSLCQRRIGLWAFVPPPPLPTSASASSETEPTPAVKQSPQRQFDILKEHRSYCPYVVRSTMVPSMPVPPISPVKQPVSSRSSTSLSQPNGNNGALEGWRAVLAVVLRHGLVQRQGTEYNLFRSGSGSDLTKGDEQMEVDGVKAMVAGVKSRGGKDLLKYVKGLLS